MATQVPSQQDLYDLYKNEIQSRNPSLTDFEEGSKLDSIGGGLSVAGAEIVKSIVDLFAKTYFATANGPEVTQGPDDLELLAVDHFGDAFARPAASSAIGNVTFSRPTIAAGNVVIPAGTIVKTEKDANGESQRYATEALVTMTGLSIGASVTAVVAGAEGNALANKVTVIESALTDPSVVVTNPLAFSGGAAVATDADYREFIRRKIETLRGATKAAIEAAALNVAGIETATAIESLQFVIEWDVGNSLPIGDYFTIPRVKLYIADVNGTASQALIDAVKEAVYLVRAFGVRIDVLAATPLSVNWSAAIILNPGGPNFATLSVDATPIVETMEQYIRDIPIGTGFDKGLAKLAIMAIWGPTGTNDLTDMSTTVPVGNISATPTQKLLPGTVQVV